MFQNLSERNKRYRSQIEQQEASRREQTRISKKVHETQLAEKDELIRNIQDLLAGHEAKLEQQDKQLQGELTETAVAYILVSSQCSTTGVTGGMCYSLCGMVHIKEPLLIIGKSSLRIKSIKLTLKYNQILLTKCNTSK